MPKQKILIVDDDTNISELISLYLNKECFETRCEENGEDALKAFSEFHPDLILLDLMLRAWMAIRSAREIRRHSQTPIIMLSARAKSSIKFLGWNWARMTISSSLLIPRNWWPASRRFSAAPL